VTVCPTQAIFIGDLNDPNSRVAEVIGRQPVAVRRPEKDTRPKVFYRGAHHATLDPLAACRPDGGIYMWSEQGKGHQQVGSGHPDGWANSSAAVLAYDVSHRAPWDWRVSLYTWTKGIAAGAWLAAVVLAFAGALDWSDALVRWVAPGLAAAFLAATGGLLIWDLEHPERFFFIFTKRQWRSWLVRGAFIIGGYGAIVGLHLVGTILGSTGLTRVVAFPGVPLAVMTAVYTAYLFAQSKGRDLWQNPLLPPHMAVQAVLAGAGALLVAGALIDSASGDTLARVLAAACAAHLLFVAGEVTLGHPTTHAHLAAWEMTRGRYARSFWAGVGLVAVGLLAPLGGPVAGLAALGGLLAHEHAYVQAAQTVPLA
jgi:formate-dependent nitrite reductase membrane component NrfD